MSKIKILKDGVETEIEVAAYFEKQEDLDKVIKSANSTGKGEILKTLGVTSVEEAKTKLGAQTQVESMEKTIKDLQTKLENETNLRIANDLSIKPALANDMIILAKSSMSDGQDFKTVLKEKADMFKAYTTSDSNTNSGSEENTAKLKMGTEKTAAQVALDKQEEEEMARFRDLDPLAR